MNSSRKVRVKCQKVCAHGLGLILYRELHEAVYSCDGKEERQKQFLIKGPDEYLLNLTKSVTFFIYIPTVDTKVSVKLILIATLVTININNMFFETWNVIVLF